ncbi:hypothetical protein [Chitinibacter sp. GC72]|nr:hypothetical protein [Chitinibacter sp. GC72]
MVTITPFEFSLLLFFAFALGQMFFFWLVFVVPSRRDCACVSRLE